MKSIQRFKYQGVHDSILYQNYAPPNFHNDTFIYFMTVFIDFPTVTSLEKDYNFEILVGRRTINPKSYEILQTYTTFSVSYSGRVRNGTKIQTDGFWYEYNVK